VAKGDKKVFWEFPSTIIAKIIIVIILVYSYRLSKPGWFKILIEFFSFKTQVCNWLEKNQLTCRVNWNPDDSAKPDRDLFFFFKCVFSHSQRPLFFIFFIWLLTHFKVHYINTRRMFYFFIVKFETL